MKLKLTFLKHVKALSTLIVIILLSVFILFGIGLSIKSIIYFFIPFFIIMVLPTMYIHFNYYNQSKGYVYEIDENEIKVIKNDNLVIFKKENFEVIKFYMSGTKLANLALRNFPFEDYFYVKIIMNDGEEVIISCLFSKEIDEILTSLYNKTPVIKIKDFYPLMLR